MKPVLFASQRELNRAENIRAVYESYDGPKHFVRLNPFRFSYELDYSDYSLMVSDEFPAETPGKAIMIGHGISGGKRFGFDQPFPYISDREPRLLTAVTCTSKQTVQLVARQCHVDPSKVYPIGMPRTDALVGAKKGEGNTVLAKYRAYLYAPTYRTEAEPRMPAIDWYYIDSSLNDGEILAIKPHMLTGDAMVRGLRHIIALPSNEPTTPYLIDSDVLITDYSSLLFDAHILGRPVVLFEKDSIKYKILRGMYYDYPKDYSSRHCTNEIDLIDLLRDDGRPRKEDLLCYARCCSACDGHSTQRVLELMEAINGKGLR